MPIHINKPGHLSVGTYFESCSFHPYIVSNVDTTGVQIEGISLVDGRTHHCNVFHCGLRVFTEQEAITWKESGPEDVALPLEERWWAEV